VAAESRSFDSSIAGINLLDAASSTSILDHAPSVEAYGFREYRFSNATRKQILVLVQHPGEMRFEISEVRVFASSAGDTSPIFPGAPSLFTSGLGVSLGLSRSEIIQLLGRPHQESGQELEYRLTLEKNPDILKSFNMPEYRAVYRFDAGRLVSFEFGFPYP